MPFTRITALWTGATGLPGYSRFRFDGALTSAEAVTAAGRVRTFFETIKALLPPGILITFSEAAQVYDNAGNLEGEVAYTPPATVTSTGVGAFSSPTGMVVNWLTNTVSRGRKVRGRTFLVPLAGTAFAVNGQPGAASVQTIQGAAGVLLGGTPRMVVFSPGRAVDVGGIPIIAGVAPITGSAVPTRAAILRSRRD